MNKLTAYFVDTDRRRRRERPARPHQSMTVARPHGLIRPASQPWVF